MNDLICRALANSDGSVEYDSVNERLENVGDLIKNARAYGTMTPRNGKYFTYKAINRDREITSKTINVGMLLTFAILSVKIPYRYVRVPMWEPTDFTLEFVSTADDEIMTSNTLMYHYYPIGSLDDPRRGVCRANSDYFWNGNGHPVDMHLIDPDNYPEPDTGTLGKIFDFDKIYRHEAVGHGHGLPHIEQSGFMMSPNESIMAEYPQPVEWAILHDKYGMRNLPSRIWERFLTNYKIWSEKYG